MNGLLERIKGEALTLPAQERAKLAQILISSLDDGLKSESKETEWDTELEIRVKEIHNGEVKGIPVEEVFAKLRKKYR